MCATDQLAQRQTGHLARNVPKCNIDATKRLHRHAFLSMISQKVVNLVPNHVSIHWVHAQNHGLNYFFNDCFIRESDIAGTKTFTPTDYSLTCMHLNQMRRQ